MKNITKFIKSEDGYSVEFIGDGKFVGNIRIEPNKGVYCDVCGAYHVASCRNKIRHIDILDWRISMFRLRR